MSLDQAGHQGAPSTVDGGGPLRRLEVLADLLDQVVLDENRTRSELLGFPVEDVDVGDERLGLLLVLLGTERREKGERDGKEDAELHDVQMKECLIPRIAMRTQPVNDGQFSIAATKDHDIFRAPDPVP
jgi:hypothetical protein